MKTRLFSLLTLLVVLISGCAQDEMLEKRRLAMISSQDVTFNASFDEESTESRTFIEEDAETSKLYLRWTKGDEISIFRGTTLNQRFQFKGETGDNSGSFKLVPNDDFVSSNELEEARNYAFYPYDENNKISEKGELTVTLPATQTYAENSFGLGANTMIALTEHTGDVDLKFKNIGGYFKFKFYGTAVNVKSVTLRGNNGEKLAGKAIVTNEFGSTPIITMDEEATETLTLDCGEGVKLGTTKNDATEFWFVLPPTTFTKGFTITVTDTNNGIFTKTTEKVFEIKRNTIKPISAMKVKPVIFDVKDEYTVDTFGGMYYIYATTNASRPYSVKISTNVDWISWVSFFYNESDKVLRMGFSYKKSEVMEREGVITVSYTDPFRNGESIYKEIKIKQKRPTDGEGGIDDMPEHEL